MEQDAAPAGRFRKPALGRRRTPPGGSKTPCEELADGGANAPKARPGAGVRTPRWRAERRRTLANQGAHIRNGCADRRAVPLMRKGERERRRRAPRRKEQGRRSVGFAGCLKIESVVRAIRPPSPPPWRHPTARPSRPRWRPWGSCRGRPAHARSRRNGVRISGWFRAKCLPDRRADDGRD